VTEPETATAGPGGATPHQRPRGAPARSERREALLDAADAALREDGPEVAMETVAARAGVTKPILYRHFGDRAGLMTAVARRHAEWLVASIREALAGQAEPRERIRVTIDTYLGFLEGDPDLHRAAARLGVFANGPHGVLDEAQAVICAEVETTIRAELTAAGLDATPAGTWGTAIVGMTRLVGARWLEEPGATRAQLADHLTDLVWRGFRGIVTNSG
jgi:AcrR family transcriptional regulator